MTSRISLLIFTLALSAYCLFSGFATTNAQSLNLASLNQDGSNLCNGGAFYPNFSDNGRFVVFNSLCTDVVPGIPIGPNVSQVYERDLWEGSTVLVSVDSTNTVGGNFVSNGADVSADGRFVLFGSAATNLIAGAVSPSGFYLRDTVLNTTVPISLKVRNCGLAPSLSADGSVVLFYASNDRQINTGSCDGFDVYAWNRLTGGSTNVSGGSQRVGQPVSHAQPAAVSPDGRFVYFTIDRDLIPEDRNGAKDVYVRDLQTGTLRIVSAPALLNDRSNGDSTLRPRYWFNPNNDSVSRDGRYVVFSSDAKNLVANPQSTDSGIFVRDTVGNSTIAVPKAASAPAGTSYTTNAHISPDGRFVIFQSLPVDAAGHFGNTEVYYFDRQSDITQLVSHTVPFNAGPRSGFMPLGISPDGRYVTYGLQFFTGYHTAGIYVRDVQTGFLTTLYEENNWDSRDYAMVAPLTGGVIFSTNRALVPADSNGVPDIYVYNPMPVAPLSGDGELNGLVPPRRR
jgi:Tol biopolymer transport system component